MSLIKGVNQYLAEQTSAPSAAVGVKASAMGLSEPSANNLPAKVLDEAYKVELSTGGAVPSDPILDSLSI